MPHLIGDKRQRRSIITDGSLVKELNEKFAREEEPKEPVEKEEVDFIPSSDIQSPEKHIILEGTSEYPTLLVAMQRSYKGLKWQAAHDALRQDGTFMMYTKPYADFLKLLESGNAYDGNGNKIDSSKLTSILDDITKVQSPWRAEWLDSKFSKKDKTTQVTYHKINQDGRLTKVTEDVEGLLKNRIPGISLEDWVNRSTKHGLPSADVKSGKLYYWAPTDGRVAGFGSNSGGAYLLCVGDPVGSIGSLGVRAARVKT